MSEYKVLVVDDEDEIRDAIEIYLKNEGIKVLKAKDGIDALMLLEEEDIHLILMDIMMPRMDGIKATFKIRENKNIPIIILSAKSVLTMLFTIAIVLMRYYDYYYNIYIEIVIGVYIVSYVLLVPLYIFKKVAYLNKIAKGTEIVAAGNFDHAIDEEGKGTLYKLAQNINNMKVGVNKSLEGQMKSERMKSELITNVSHDLKTPLTSIINYIDLLKNKELSQEEMGNYIEILDRKSQRLKVLIEDLFEASKVASGAVELNIEKVDVVSLLRQSMGEFDEKIKNSSLTFKVNMPIHNVHVSLDGKKTWRVFENLISNILKYS